jgi:predicted metal-binding protein
MTDKEYIAVVQCHLVKQRCSGYFCEKSFHERSGAFADYAEASVIRTLYLTCGGCSGRALQRKLSHLVRRLGKHEDIHKEQVVVHLSSCITHDSHHGPPCPHLDYLCTLIGRLGLDVVEGTRISELSERRRVAGQYAPAPEGAETRRGKRPVTGG